MPQIALTGAGAPDAVRALLLAVLTSRPSQPTEVLISRTDAEELFGLGAGDLATERIPGLRLVKDFPTAIAHLRLPGSRRLFVTCDGGLDLLNDVLDQHLGNATAISLAPWLYDSAEVDADSRVVTFSEPELASHLPEVLPLLTPAEFFDQLVELPTVIKPRANSTT